MHFVISIRDKLKWTTAQEGSILAALFYGYIVIPGGFFDSQIVGKTVL